MRRIGIWSRRWRGAVWCGLCVLCLAALVLREALHYLLREQDAHTGRRCPPPPMELDGCASWRPLLVAHPTCACTRRLLVLHDKCRDFVASDADGYLLFMEEHFGRSTCSEQATLRGPRQHVISVSSDDINSTELAALNATITQINELYKGWVLRLYTRVTSHNRAVLCSLACANHNLDLCDVRNLSEPLSWADESGRFGWRWAALGDPLVSTWAVRQLDVAILSREAHAVTQFINSDKCWHVMKDHSSHIHDLRGSGLLSGKTSWGASELHHIRRRLLLEIKNTDDEKLILKELQPLMGDVMTHDSVSCRQSPGAVPFPSRRRPGQWVGMPAPKPQQQLGLTLSKPLAARYPMNETSERPSRRETPADHFTPEEKTGFILGSLEHGASLGPLRGARLGRTLHAAGFAHGTSRLDGRSEVEINQQRGIRVCPASCRPLLHPDWHYC